MEKEKLVALVARAQQGEPDAGGALYEAFYQDIYYFILKNVDNQKELAEDLTQETFIEILQTIGKLQEPAAFVTWSRQVAYHRCTAYFRKRTELLADEDEDGYSVFDTMEEDRAEFIPGELLDQADFKDTIHKMLMELPAEQRSAIFLRYFDEISVKEIAQIQGVTEGTVKSRLNYGRNAIRKAVEDYEKKHDIKLHSVAILPVMLWLFRKFRLAQGVCSAAEVTATAAGATAATSAVSAGVKTGVSVGVKKMIAAAVAVATVGGGVTAGVVLSQPEETPNTSSVMEWSGYGGVYFATNMERHLEIVVEEMTDTHIRGYLKATLHGVTEHESRFTGAGTPVEAGIRYQLTYETPEQIKKQGVSVYTKEYEEDFLIYSRQTDTFSFCGQQEDAGLYQGTLYREDPQKEWQALFPPQVFSGETGTRQYRLHISQITGAGVQGELTVVSHNGKILHTTAFTGEGYLHAPSVYRYDLQFATPGEDAYGNGIYGIWMRYDANSGQIALEGNYQANLIPEK